MKEAIKDPDPYRDAKMSTDRERDYRAHVESYYENSPASTIVKLQNFAKYVPRQTLTRFLARYELFKKVLNVHGSIVECGVLEGGGFMTWAHLSSIFEPVNWSRKIIGFDTFEGFPSVSEKDDGPESSEFIREGALASHAYEDILQAISVYDQNRFLNHIPKCELVRGDVCRTVPRWLEENSHAIVSLLYLDMDVYEPTLAALKTFYPRMPSGAVIAFDEVNAPNWPGETSALFDYVGELAGFRLQRFEFDSLVSYAVIE